MKANSQHLSLTYDATLLAGKPEDRCVEKNKEDTRNQIWKVKTFSNHLRLLELKDMSVFAKYPKKPFMWWTFSNMMQLRTVAAVCDCRAAFIVRSSDHYVTAC